MHLVGSYYYIANGVIRDKVTGLSKAFLPLFSNYYNASRYIREWNFIQNHMKSTSFLASNVVVVKNDNKVMFRSLMSNFAHIAQEMWEALFELYPTVIKKLGRYEQNFISVLIKGTLFTTPYYLKLTNAKRHWIEIF